MKAFNVVAFLLLLLGGTPAWAADLSSLQNKALTKRDIVKQYQLNVEKSVQELQVARGGYYPSLDIGYRMTALDEASQFEPAEQSAAFATISWNLFSGFQDRYGIAEAELTTVAEKYRLQGLHQDIRLLVALRYLDVHERQEALKVAQDTLTTLNRVYEDGHSRMQVGLVSENDLLKIKVDRGGAEIAVKRAEAELRKAVQQLERESGVRLAVSELDFTIFNQLPEIDEALHNEEQVLSRRSALLILRELEGAAALRVKTEKAGGYPQVNLSTSYQATDDHFLNGQGDVSAEEIRTQIVLSMNLFDGHVRGAKISKTSLEHRSIRYELAELESDLITDFNNLLLDFGVAQANVSVAQTTKEQAQENLRVTRLKYGEGLTQEADVLDAVAGVSRARANFVGVVRLLFANYYQILRAVEQI
ncbi:MAG: TolC family protein [Desulfobulbaceae bacterium]|uniref:TolC family protein n=1 Tax=Candidatus Desulfatifera sulfidica TaxID=2841691 RepID=A0A8J6N8Y2_9BACT|nr:TolC family protein [Candidatus Desulfatifera sulfidica]